MKFLKYFLIFPLFLNAELVIEITKGSDNPYRIALIPFQGESDAAKQANEIVKNDLIRTGEFYIFDEKSLIAYPPSEEDINYSDWRLINADFLLLTSVIDSNSGIEARYEIFDVRKKSKIRSSKVYGVTNNIRQLAHYVSDGIYEAITGIQGVASTKILYVSQSNDVDTSYRLYVADADGVNEQLLVKSPEPIISPAWSPDSKKVAYVSFETGIANVYIQDISTGERQSIIEKRCLTCISNEQISSPSWSPDGKYLSLTLYQDGNAEIYIYNLQKRNLTRLTNHYSIDTESQWSPDGRKLMFTSGRSGSPQLYELDLRKLNKKPKRLTFEGNYNAKGSYLPGGEGIVFVHRSSDKFQIAIKYFEDNFVIPLTDAKMDESPSVSPNGNVIIYAISEQNNDILAGVTLSGAKFRLPSAKGQVREPAWSGFLK